MALEVHPDFVIIDERRAALMAIALGLNVTGTVGVLSDAAEQNLLDLRTAFAQLRQTTFHPPEAIMAALLREDELRRNTSSE